LPFELPFFELPFKVNLKTLVVSNNLLNDLNLDALQGEKLTYLDLANNNFLEQDLGCFSKFKNLEELNLGS